MKPWFKLAVIPALVLAATACQQKEPEVKLEDDQSKQAYAIGASVAEYISKSLAKQEELGIKLDKNIVVAGFKDGIHGQAKLDQEAMTAVLQALDKQAVEASQAKAEADAEANKVAGVKFLEENGKREGVVTTESGLQYEVLQEGEGAKPAATDRVQVHYEGTLIPAAGEEKGKVFDSSYERGQPLTFPLNGVIRGWTEGVQLMSVGSKYRFFIPSELAYGERGAGSDIGPHSTLIFEVELLDIEGQENAQEAAPAEEGHQHEDGHQH
ncbi:FKBP-type peptidyl-prolyl cis-trans isomerase [Gallaecimonas sp. GXIMD4217]|uniref:FKBP-type peptidyl-prolyl cis-trans isomerase n=1 Tax=Gallaecimonas sp. GXIMD4217 TaxID=3131927 RepID=UPI00311AEF7A